MEFFDNLSSALNANGGTLTLEQVVELLPDSQKHRVMTHLNSARNSGICAYTARVTNGKGEVVISAPKASVGGE